MLTQGLELAGVYQLKAVISLRLLTQKTHESIHNRQYDPRTHLFQFRSNRSQVTNRYFETCAEQLSKKIAMCNPVKSLPEDAPKYVQIVVTCQVEFEAKSPDYHGFSGGEIEYVCAYTFTPVT